MKLDQILKKLFNFPNQNGDLKLSRQSRWKYGPATIKGIPLLKFAVKQPGSNTQAFLGFICHIIINGGTNSFQ